MKKVLIFVADGSEETEAIQVTDYLRRAEISVDLVSINDTKEVETAHGIKILADKTIDCVNVGEYDAVYVPGGLPGAYNLRDDERVLDIIREMFNSKKIVSALCAGPVVLDAAGVLDNKKFTCYPGFQENIKSGIYRDSLTVVDENVITGKGPAVAAPLAYTLIEVLDGKEKREEIEGDTLFNYLFR